MKWSVLVDSGELAGYRNGAPLPTGPQLVDGAEIDREIAETSPCEECGGAMEFLPMFAGRSYRAFSRCKKCGDTIEF